MPSEKLHQIRQNFVNYPAKLKTTSMADVTITKPLCDWLGTVQTVYDLRNFFFGSRLACASIVLYRNSDIHCRANISAVRLAGTSLLQSAAP